MAHFQSYYLFGRSSRYWAQQINDCRTSSEFSGTYREESVGFGSIMAAKISGIETRAQRIPYCVLVWRLNSLGSKFDWRDCLHMQVVIAVRGDQSVEHWHIWSCGICRVALSSPINACFHDVMLARERPRNWSRWVVWISDRISGWFLSFSMAAANCQKLGELWQHLATNPTSDLTHQTRGNSI